MSFPWNTPITFPVKSVNSYKFFPTTLLTLHLINRLENFLFLKLGALLSPMFLCITSWFMEKVRGFDRVLYWREYRWWASIRFSFICSLTSWFLSSGLETSKSGSETAFSLRRSEYSEPCCIIFCPNNAWYGEVPIAVCKLLRTALIIWGRCRSHFVWSVSI